MKKYVIIVAGGSGSRMNSDVPKQFMLIEGKPVLMHTITRFTAAFPEITVILVLAKQLNDEWATLCKKHDFKIPHQLTDGGETRYHSVKNGLELVPDAVVVGIHDAARPLVSDATIKNTFAAAEERGNATPSVLISDSLRYVKGVENTAVDRNHYHIVQTPQCFHSDLIKKAFLKAYKPEFTDDASVLEAFGEKINLVEGNRENIKITTTMDLVIAEVLVKLI
ncbi:MAG: 2-C-methyl-D-erythritol 4-phosphate cytidylyltransferase [Bacteroidetes bacterium]|nr:2-C-methyl-D-erythritol 4-phosphate cytidylyltransferase [Bacteroidota bacterium]